MKFLCYAQCRVLVDSCLKLLPKLLPGFGTNVVENQKTKGWDVQRVYNEFYLHTDDNARMRANRGTSFTTAVAQNTILFIVD